MVIDIRIEEERERFGIESISILFIIVIVTAVNENILGIPLKADYPLPHTDILLNTPIPYPDPIPLFLRSAATVHSLSMNYNCTVYTVHSFVHESQLYSVQCTVFCPWSTTVQCTLYLYSAITFNFKVMLINIVNMSQCILTSLNVAIFWHCRNSNYSKIAKIWKKFFFLIVFWWKCHQF